MDMYPLYVQALSDALAVGDIDYTIYRTLKDAADRLNVHIHRLKTAHIQHVHGHVRHQQ